MRLRLILPSMLCLSAPVSADKDFPVDLPPVDTVAIRSDQAWEDTDPGVMHFSGHFSLTATDWVVVANSAIVYGKLDDPETVRLDGEPASFQIRSGEGAQAEIIAGNAGRITYLRRQKIVQMERDAQLYWDENVLRSEQIEYDLDTDQIRASGLGGVSLRFPPLD